MKKIFRIVTFLCIQTFCLYNTFAQSAADIIASQNIPPATIINISDNPKKTRYTNTTKPEKNENVGISGIKKDYFPLVYNTYFSKVISINSASASPSNYFALDAKDVSAKINYSYPFFRKNKTEEKIVCIVAGKLEGSLTEDIVSLINSNKLLPGVSFSANFSFPVNSKFYYYQDTLEKKLKNIDNTKQYYKIKTELLDDELIKLDAKKTKTIADIAAGTITHAEGDFTIKEIELKLHELSIQKTNATFDKLQEDSIKNINLAFNYSTVRLLWVDVYGDVSRKQFNKLNDTFALSSFKEQIDVKYKFTGFKVGISFNAFFQSIHNAGLKALSGYYKLNIGVTRANNAGDLSSYDVDQSVTSKDSVSTSVRKISNKLTTINNIGKSYKEYYTLNFGYDIYKFLSAKQIASIHFFNEYDFLFYKKSDNISNKDLRKRCLASVGVGLVFSANNKKDKSVVNVEPYVKFTDLFNFQETINKEAGVPDVKDRNEVGIRINFNLPSLIKG